MFNIITRLLYPAEIASGARSSSNTQTTGPQTSQSWSAYIFSFFHNADNSNHYKTTAYTWKPSEKMTEPADTQGEKTTATRPPFIEKCFPCLRDNSKKSIKSENSGNPQSVETTSSKQTPSVSSDQIEEAEWASLSPIPPDNKEDSYSWYQFGIALLAFDKEFAESLPTFTLQLNKYFDIQNKFTWEERAEALKQALTAFGYELRNSEYVKKCTILNLNKTLLFDKYAIRALESLPEVIRYFQNLQVLILDNNQIASLPACLAQLPIVELSLNNNWFISLPEVILQMKSLKKLSFFENHIEALPPELSSLQNLEVICMDGCQSLIDSLPNSLPKLREIRLFREILDSKEGNSSGLELADLKRKYPNVEIALQNRNNTTKAYAAIRSKL
jgi:Leucine-rich repeat (LRR) protein